MDFKTFNNSLDRVLYGHLKVVLKSKMVTVSSVDFVAWENMRNFVPIFKIDYHIGRSINQTLQNEENNVNHCHLRCFLGFGSSLF